LCHKLARSLFIFITEEKRAVICFLWVEGVPGAEMHRRISVQFGNSVMSQRMVYKWIKKFKKGPTSIKHKGNLFVEPKEISTASAKDLCLYIKGRGLLNLS
jgi:hypothetical protein